MAFPLLQQLLGLALGSLLVFRTNASSDRFREERKLWGGIVNECRNLTRLAVAHLAKSRHPDLLLPLARFVSAFPYAAMHQLRDTEGRSVDAEIVSLLRAQHAPLSLSTALSTIVRQATERGAFAEVVTNSFETNVQRLLSSVGTCERIRKTPLPYRLRCTFAPGAGALLPLVALCAVA